MQHCPGPSAAAPGAQCPHQPGSWADQGRGLPPAPQPHQTQAYPNGPCPEACGFPMSCLGLRDPPAKRFSSPRNSPSLSWLETPCLPLVSPLPRELDPVTRTRAHTPAPSHARSDPPEPRCPVDISSDHQEPGC
ncbi:hypothetical protein mRhiFer1_009372 [Rhinolophus ferrumequinum]|uniref:Uncharacterized protein n=1 Tax=Rhinolophus ferrumequinum TaxID=59479 RepID=A0A7J7RQ72_RHIFE|nr:hypothetical protein mRhiFer1_009372 [Rhinolophus ferrumequinum]